MLFGYPIAATYNNWLHDSIVAMLAHIHNYPDARITWPEIIPEPSRAALSAKHGLRRHLISYQETLLSLPSIERDAVLDTLHGQNDIVNLLSGNSECNTIDGLPEIIRQPIKELFAYCFDLLADVDIRDEHYEIIYNSAPFHMCPFCGLKDFKSTKAPRESLDHYLPKSQYPFAAANLRNLAPICEDCNKKKSDIDILHKDDGSRRKVMDPYEATPIQIRLLQSRPFEGLQQPFPLPEWHIEFVPDSEYTNSWDSIFDIRQRYKRDFLDAEFITLLRQFSIYCQDHRVNANSMSEIIQTLDYYADYLYENGMKDKSFLKSAVFKMLYYHCSNGNQRLREIVCATVIGGMSLRA